MGSHTISVGLFREIATCFVAGSGIFLVVVYINVCFKVSFSWNFICPVILTAGIPEICDLTLMLGNNLCDHDVDIVNDHHTLISYTGIKGGLHLLAFNCLLGSFSTG